MPKRRQYIANPYHKDTSRFRNETEQTSEHNSL